MANLTNGLVTAEKGSTVWRIIYNTNFQKLDDMMGNLDSNYYTKTESDNRYYTQSHITSNYYTKAITDSKYAPKTAFYRTKTNLTLQNSWTNVGTPYEDLSWTRDDYDLVHIQGVVKDGAAGTVIATLPSSARPSGVRLFPITTATNTFGTIEINTDGEIIFRGGDNTKVSVEITFRR